MLAARYYGIQDVRSEIIEKPKAKYEEVLVKVKYAGICGSDLHIYNQGMFIQNIPETMGHEFVGVIEEIGENVSRFKKGDAVIANPMVPCMKCNSCIMGSYNTCHELGFIGEVSQGCFAEYLAVPESKLIKVPKGADLQKVALSEPLAVAINICKRAKLQKTDSVALIGTGPIGLLTIIVAREIYGVENITAVDLSNSRLELAKKVGANSMYNILPEDITFNKVIEAAGAPVTFKTALDHVEANGFLFVVSIFEKDFIFDINSLVASQITLIGCNVYADEDLRTAVEYISNNRLDVSPLISREFELTQCQEAFQLLNSADKSVAKILFKI